MRSCDRVNCTTIPELIAKASNTHRIVMLFCGLGTQEQHIRRVALRVAGGGHDIPADKIRERWNSSRANLILLLPRPFRLQVFDNSVEAARGEDIPDPILVLETDGDRVIFPNADDAVALQATPDWARPIVQVAIEFDAQRQLATRFEPLMRLRTNQSSSFQRRRVVFDRRMSGHQVLSFFP